MQPLLTGARKNNARKKQQMTIAKKKSSKQKMFRSNVYRKIQQSPLKTRNTGG